MTRWVASSLLVFAVAAFACQSSEKKPETGVSSLSAAPSPNAPPAAGAQPAVVGKAIDPSKLTTLALDPASSTLEIVAAKVTRKHDGAFKQFSGSASLAGDQIQGVSFDVDTASLTTDTEKLTEHIKTKDFLDVEKFPKATFKSTSVVVKPAAGATHEVTGQLTLHGVTNEISFPVLVVVTPESVKGSGEIHIDRKKFGVVYPGMPDDLIKDDVVLKPVFVFPRQK
jgi:polyisoprenoid-binding protein YceI